MERKQGMGIEWGSGGGQRIPNHQVAIKHMGQQRLGWVTWAGFKVGLGAEIGGSGESDAGGAWVSKPGNCRADRAILWASAGPSQQATVRCETMPGLL